MSYGNNSSGWAQSIHGGQPRLPSLSEGMNTKPRPYSVDNPYPSYTGPGDPTTNPNPSPFPDIPHAGPWIPSPQPPPGSPPSPTDLPPLATPPRRPPMYNPYPNIPPRSGPWQPGPPNPPPQNPININPNQFFTPQYILSKLFSSWFGQNQVGQSGGPWLPEQSNTWWG